MNRRRIELEFDDFGRTHVAAEAERRRVAVEELLGQAALACVSARGSASQTWRVPDLRKLGSCREPGAAASGGGESFSLDLAERDWRALEAEAADQRVPLELLVQHAALYLVAAEVTGSTPTALSAP